jgi:hypothetical protein
MRNMYKYVQITNIPGKSCPMSGKVKAPKIASTTLQINSMNNNL